MNNGINGGNVRLDTPEGKMLKKTRFLVFALLLTCAPAYAANSPNAQGEQAATASSGKAAVEIYITDWCGYCKKTRKYLESKGIPYVAYDIEKDGAAKIRYQEMGGEGVPLIVIGQNKIAGFAPAQIDYYLSRNK